MQPTRTEVICDHLRTNPELLARVKKIWSEKLGQRANLPKLVALANDLRLPNDWSIRASQRTLFKFINELCPLMERVMELNSRAIKPGDTVRVDDEKEFVVEGIDEEFLVILEGRGGNTSAPTA